MKSRAFLSLGIGSLMLASTVTVAMGSTASKTPPITSQTIGSGSTHLTFWNGITGANEPSLLAWLHHYKDPSVSIQAQEIAWATIYQKLPVAFHAGDPPNIMMLHPYDMMTYAKDGMLTPLDGVAQTLVSKKTMKTNSVWTSNNFYGKQYAVPIGVWDELWYYNPQMWAKIGYPDGPPLHNPSALLKAFQKLTVTKNGKTQTWGLGMDDLNDTEAMLVLQSGGKLYDSSKAYLNSSQDIKALTYMGDLVNKYKVSPNPSGLDATALFEQGKLATFIEGEWVIPGLQSYTQSGGKVKWAVTKQPVLMIPGGKQVTLTGGPAFAIPKSQANGSAQVAEDEKFIKWAVSHEAGWAVNGGLLPVTRSKANVRILKKNPAQLTAYEQLNKAIALPTIDQWSQFNQLWGTMIQQVTEANKPVQQSADSAQQQAASLFNQ